MLLQGLGPGPSVPQGTLGKSLPSVGLGFPSCTQQLDESSLQACQPGALALPAPPGSQLRACGILSQTGDRIINRLQLAVLCPGRRRRPGFPGMEPALESPHGTGDSRARPERASGCGGALRRPPSSILALSHSSRAELAQAAMGRGWKSGGQAQQGRVPETQLKAEPTLRVRLSGPGMLVG